MAISARYWGLRNADVPNAWSRGRIAEIRIYASDDCSGDYIACSAYGDNFLVGYPPSNLADGNTATIWTQANAYEIGVKVWLDPGYDIEINSMAIYCHHYESAFRAVEMIMSEDGISWNRIYGPTAFHTVPGWSYYTAIQKSKTLITLASPLGAGRMIHTLGR